jgi:hypothetical protein
MRIGEKNIFPSIICPVGFLPTFLFHVVSSPAIGMKLVSNNTISNSNRANERCVSICLNEKNEEGEYQSINKVYNYIDAIVAYSKYLQLS